MNNNLVIVSNRLPISVKKTDSGLEFFPSIGGLATGLAGFTDNKDNLWIGWPGISLDVLTPNEITEITKHLSSHNCYPVFLTQKQIDYYYSGYSNRILWPLFHNISISPDAIKGQNNFWKSYQKVNTIFAKAILDISTPGSNIWIHDYHLLLLPDLIRKQRPNDKIGFFQHIPFADAENFLKLAQSKSLLKGILGANIIGFHTKGYADNFVENCVNHNLGLINKNEISINGRKSLISNFPMGIDYNKFKDGTQLSKTKIELKSLQNKYKNLKVILNVDRLDPSKGLVERVKAYRDFLRNNKPFLKKVTMIMLTMPSRTKIEEYIKLHSELEKLIKDVNAEFRTDTWEPIEYMYTCLTFEKLLALYQRADIAFVAPLCDGMNLVAKEYLACKTNNDGILILSNTAGAAEELEDALIVDPADRSTLVKALEQAISMSKDEMQQRIKNLQKQISTFTIQTWCDNFVNALAKPSDLFTKNIEPTFNGNTLSTLNTTDSLIINIESSCPTGKKN